MDTLTPVIFRKYKDIDVVVAIFPTIPGTTQIGTCQCYEHVGQHGWCDISWIQNTTLATPDEYKDLMDELVSLGYDNLKVYKRMAHWFWNARMQALWGGE